MLGVNQNLKNVILQSYDLTKASYKLQKINTKRLLELEEKYPKKAMKMNRKYAKLKEYETI